MRKALYILGDLIEDDVLFLSKAGDIVELDPGDAVIRSGVEVEALYFVTSGELEVRLDNGTVVASLGIGDVAGEMSFVEKRPPEASVVAKEPSRLLAIGRDKLGSELDQNPAFAARFYRALATFLSDRLRTTTLLAAGDGATDDEIDERLLDMVHVAGDRLLRLIRLMDTGARL